MRKYKKVMKEERVVSEWLCNKCGKTFQPDPDGFDNGVKSFDVGFGYDSGFDMEHWSFDLCTDCLLDVIRTFRIVPDGFMLYYHEETPEDHQQKFERWKETGKWH